MYIFILYILVVIMYQGFTIQCCEKYPGISVLFLRDKLPEMGCENTVAKKKYVNPGVVKT